MTLNKTTFRQNSLKKLKKASRHNRLYKSSLLNAKLLMLLKSKKRGDEKWIREIRKYAAIPPTKSNACISWAISILKKVSPGITSKLAPGTNLAARKIDKTPATMCQNSRSINDILIENYTL